MNRVRSSTKPPTRPTFIVETSLAEAVTPKLDAWLDDLDDAIPRVINNTDSEAVHDLRVAMRRIRSLLRVVRPVFGRFYVKLIRDEVKSVADATGSLRDEEVLAETIAALSLDDAHRRALEPWLARRQQRDESLRGNVVRLLQSGALDAPRTHLRALIRLPVPPGQDKEAHKFARKVVFAAHAQVEALRSADVDDVVRMHDLRIAYKRLRYAVEALGPVLPPELRAWGQVASKFQKVLGNLHDHDVALDVVREAKTLSEDTRAAVLEALRAKRAHYAKQYVELVGFGVASPPNPAKDDKSKRAKQDRKTKARKAKGGSKSAPAKSSTKSPPTKTASSTTTPGKTTETAAQRTRRGPRNTPAKKTPAAKAPARKRTTAKKAPTQR